MDNKPAAKVPYKSLIFGVFFIILGIAMTLYTTGSLPTIKDLWPVMLLVFGLLLVYIVYAKGASDIYLFPGYLCALAGLSFLIINILPPGVEIRKIWPIFMTNTGIALFLYAHTLSEKKRINFIVPAYSIIALSLIFFLFSFDIVEISFLAFIRKWWPLLILFTGLFLVCESLFRKR